MKRIIAVTAFAGIILAGCGKPTAQEYFSKAESLEAEVRTKVDTVKSEASARAVYQPLLETLEKLVEEYPTHNLSEQALFHIASIRNNNTHETQRAVDAYRLYLERYPEGKHAEVALFLVGYLYNNELHNIDSASVVYTRFLARYPESQYAVSARFELNTLGKPLEELIPAAPVPEKVAKKKQARKALH